MVQGFKSLLPHYPFSCLAALANPAGKSCRYPKSLGFVGSLGLGLLCNRNPFLRSFPCPSMVRGRNFDVRFTPEMLVEYDSKRRGICIEEFGVAPTVVICWNLRATKSLAEKAKAKQSKSWPYGEFYPLFRGKVGRRPVCFAHAPVGAPATIMFMEEMSACGAKAFIGFGYAGSLSRRAPIGSCLVPTECIREEGTSSHYIGPREKAPPSERMRKGLMAACKASGLKALSGPHWTTDGVYRELVSKIANYGKRGVLGVDMETSAMYAFCKFKGFDVCNLLVVSDELWGKWNPAFGKDELRQASARAEDALLYALKKKVV